MSSPEKCNVLNLQYFHLSVQDIDMIKKEKPEFVLKYRGYEDMTVFKSRTLFDFISFQYIGNMHFLSN